MGRCLGGISGACVWWSPQKHCGLLYINYQLDALTIIYS